MEGRTHAIAGAAAWVALTSVAPTATGAFPLESASILAGAVLCAGASLLPDIDHPTATVANSVPIFGAATARAVQRATGGHRQGLHSLVAVALVFATSLLLGFFTVAPFRGELPVSINSGLAALFLTTFAVKATGLVRSWGVAWLNGLVAGLLLASFFPESGLWLPMCVTLGFALHLAGDMMTIKGIPLFWPLRPKQPQWVQRSRFARTIWRSDGFFSIPLLGRVGSRRELMLAAILGLYTIVTLGLSFRDTV